jgi:Glycosyltransferase family 87
MTTRAVAVLLLAFFIVVMFRKSWTTDESDFPNYYTAAVLASKRLPLRDYYDWTWFQRQMNFVGFERQLGAYAPQTPLTMLPFLPIAGFAPQTAKRIWLVFNLGCLGVTVWLLSRLTGFRFEQMTIVAFLGFGSLYSNFYYGQYYIFLLLLLTLASYSLDRRKSTVSGFLSGVTFGLKLYGGPLLLYFAVRKNWKAVAGFATAAVCAFVGAVMLFGWGDVHYYATQILPRALEGETIDPYNSGNGTMSTLLRRLFVPEPELNPQPLCNAPVVFFLLRPFLSLLILGATLAGLAGERGKFERRDFAWFLIAILLLSANTASYTFILLLLPVSLLLVHAKMVEKLFLLAAFFALCFPLRPGWSMAFPKLWVLLAVFFVVGRHYFRSLGPKHVVGVVIVAAVLASMDARRHILSYAAEPGRQWEHVAVEKNAIFSSSPAVSRAGLFYQSIGGDRYVLRWLHDGRMEELAFEGHAFHPVAPLPDGLIYFELVARGASTTMAFDPIKRLVAPGFLPDYTKAADSVVSPDGKWVAFESAHGGPRQIGVRNIVSGSEKRLTGGNCNSSSPAWELDSKAVIFASDCGRGIGLPSLYRARIGIP